MITVIGPKESALIIVTIQQAALKISFSTFFSRIFRFD
jgi:hypothetical protein